MLIGRNNLGALAERGSTTRDVNSISIHPDWKVSTEKWDADIAIISFFEPVKFSQYIRPVCLSSKHPGETYNSDSGTVVRSKLALVICHSSNLELPGGMGRK